MASALVLASDVRVPRFFTLEFSEYGSYSTYVRDGGEMDGCIKFEETNVESPYTKFEAEAAGADGLFHIRSCQNNKYWERNKIQHKGWITATAKKKEENQTKASCTLFKFITVDAFMKTVRVLHVQSGNYLCLPVTDQPTTTTTDRCASADYNVLDHEGHDILRLIDWSSVVVLPLYVAFKGDNGKYLRLRPQNPKWDYLEFSADEFADPNVPCVLAGSSAMSIKTLSNNKFWKLSPTWIWADGTNSADINCRFHPVQVDDTTIALINVGNSRYCRRLTAERKTDCLNASANTIIREARLTVEEPVLRREIYDVQYYVKDARVYDASVLVVARNSARNTTQQSNILSVKLSYKDVKTTTWKSNLSLKLAMKATASFRIPLIVNGKVEISSEVQSVTEWGKTTTTTTVMEVVYHVVVPAMTKVTVDLVATKGFCDVPFSYTQKDTLYDGKTVRTTKRSTYTGSNYYSNDFVVREEKL